MSKRRQCRKAGRDRPHGVERPSEQSGDPADESGLVAWPESRGQCDGRALDQPISGEAGCDPPADQAKKADHGRDREPLRQAGQVRDGRRLEVEQHVREQKNQDRQQHR